MNAEKIEFEVTFFFCSGEFLIVDFEKEKFEKLIEGLNRGWKTTVLTSDTFGINFSLVTHYKVKNE